jgi:hypothetical protein
MRPKVPTSRAVLYFFAIMISVALGLSALIGWHNAVVGEPTALHLLVRALISIVVFLIAGLVFVVLVVDRR